MISLHYGLFIGVFLRKSLFIWYFFSLLLCKSSLKVKLKTLFSHNQNGKSIRIWLKFFFFLHGINICGYIHFEGNKSIWWMLTHLLYKICFEISCTKFTFFGLMTPYGAATMLLLLVFVRVWVKCSKLFFFTTLYVNVCIVCSFAYVWRRHFCAQSCWQHCF